VFRFLTLAWNLARADRRRLLLLAACVAIGIAARAFVGTITAQAEVALAREARPLLGGDIEIAANEVLDDAHRAELDRVLPVGSTTTATIGFTSMAASENATHLVEVRAIHDDFPLLDPVPFAASEAEITTLSEATATHQGLPGIAVEATALTTFSIALGDELRLGQRRFRVTAVLGDDPGLTGSPFTLGPRLVMHADAVAATGLTGFGSRTRHAVLVRLPNPLETATIAKQLAEAWKLPDTEMGFGARGDDQRVQVRTAQQAQLGLRRIFERLGDFLRLAALGSLLVAAVGVAALVAATVRGRADELAVLATLGCPPRRSGRLLLVQITMVTTVAGAIGALAGGGLAQLVILAIRDAFPLPIQTGWSPAAMLSGWGIGITIALTAALFPLGTLRSLKPLAVLRGETPELRNGIRHLPTIIGALVIVTGIAAWEAHSWLTGPVFIAALVVGAIVARGLIAVVLAGIARWRIGPPALRLGLSNLNRPGLGSATAATAIAVSATLLAGPLVHRASLVALLDQVRGSGAPALFVIDIRPNELETFTTTVHDETGSDPVGLSPMITARYRGRVGEADDAPPKGSNREAQRARFFRNREQRLSWRAEPGPDEDLVTGRWAQPRPDSSDGKGECTLDQDFARRLGVDVGDVLRFDVQGVPIELTVVGLRDVDFLGLKPNFFILTDIEVLAQAPHTWIAAVASDDPVATARSISAALPTVTAIDVSAIARQIRRVAENIFQALTVVAAFAIAAGAVVLGALASASARERRADAALLRVLGANNGRLRLAAGAEFASQGLAASVIGVTVGVGVAAVGLRIAHLSVVVVWSELLALVAIITLITVVVGLFAVRASWREPPLSVLRQE
jgi:putative ABC transport system permease protein